MYEAGHPKPVLCDSLEGWGGEGVWGGVVWGGGEGLRVEGTRVCLWSIHVDLWQKPSQCVIILQFK